MTDATDTADRLHSAALHLMRRLRREDTGDSLSAARRSALSVIVYAGPITVGKLADLEQVRSPTMTRMVAQLVDDGLAERTTVPGDARWTLVSATDAGREIITNGRRRRVEALAERLALLPAEDLATLRRAAELLAEVIETPHHH